MEAEKPAAEKSAVTLSRHLAERGVARELSEVIISIAGASKAICAKIRRARIEDVIGAAGSNNVHGEHQEKLDVLTNALMLEALRGCACVAVAASEEEDDAVLLRPGGAAFAVVFDPLDGSSNIDVAAGVGTIFSILPCACADPRAPLQAGDHQVAAGYVLYGSSTLLVLTTGDGVDVFVLDPEDDDFVRVIEGLRIPEARKIYSLNEAYANDFSEGYRRYLHFTHSAGYAGRYIGSMVADVHRTLIKGGVFLYPPTVANPSGKLRLLYEANPMALLIEQAGGTASTGAGRILEVVPGELHQRVPVVLGSPVEVEHVLKHL